MLPWLRSRECRMVARGVEVTAESRSTLVNTRVVREQRSILDVVTLDVVTLEGTEVVPTVEQSAHLLLEIPCSYLRAWTSRRPYITSGLMLRTPMLLFQDNRLK
jgi:hypothetical protein